MRRPRPNPQHPHRGDSTRVTSQVARRARGGAVRKKGLKDGGGGPQGGPGVHSGGPGGG